MTGSKQSDAAAVVLDLDGGEMLSRCVESLDAQSTRFTRIVILDNGSSVPVDQRLDVSRFATPVTMLRSDRNLGFAAGMNRALAAVEEPFVALVNNDVVADPAWLERLRAKLDSKERAAAIQPVIRTTEGLVDGAGIDVSDGTMRQTGFGDSIDRAANYPREPWGVSATAALFRTVALRNAGEVFDERLFTYYEDVELCARLRRDGWTFLLEPAALATHLGSASESRVASLYFRVRNRYFVHRIHRNVGRTGALLSEDARRIARLVVKGRVGAALTVLRAIVAGLTRRLS